MVRNLASIAAGFLSMMGVWMVLMAVWWVVGAQLAPDEFEIPEAGQEPRAPGGIGWLLTTLAIDAAAAALGGLVVAIVSRDRRGTVIRITTGLLATACVLQVLGDQGRLPLWLPLARTVIAPAALYFAARWWLGGWQAAAPDDDRHALPEPGAAGDSPGNSSTSSPVDKRP